MFGSKDPTCPFFAFFSLIDVLDVASPDGIVVGCNKLFVVNPTFDQDRCTKHHYVL